MWWLVTVLDSVALGSDNRREIFKFEERGDQLSNTDVKKRGVTFYLESLQRY